MSNITTILTNMEKNNSIFEANIRTLEIPLCTAFKDGNKIMPVNFESNNETISTKDTPKVNEQFPKTSAASENKILLGKGKNPNPAKGKRVAVLFSGGPAAGGHNLIVGLKKILGTDNTLLGVKGGPKGLLQGNLFEITDADVARITNTGGFDFLGSDRTKIKTDEQFEAVKKTCVDNNLDALVVIGGDDSNTNATILAELLYENIKPDGSGIQVIGCPKTIDGDLQIGDFLPISFGFDTATRIYAELCGNILQDTPSSLKYWHFVKLMGRAASHVALEVALQTKAAVTVISEEVAEKNMSLAEVVNNVASVIIDRAKRNINHGMVLIPEGLIEFIPEFNTLIEDISDKMAGNIDTINSLSIKDRVAFIPDKIAPAHTKLYNSLPPYIQEMLVADRDSHGNLQVSLIPTEKLLIDMVTNRVKEIDPKIKFATQDHFFGYEGRCGAPTLFDAAYTYNIGLTAGSLILAGKTGYIASITNLNAGGCPAALPLTGLLNIERRHGKDEMVIEKALVKLDSPAFKYFASRRDIWAKDDVFCSPGPRQLWGPASNQISMTVALNRNYSSLEFKF